MNTANLQFQGTLIALYVLLQAMKAKGVLVWSQVMHPAMCYSSLCHCGRRERCCCD
jgi:hypothetical protein